MKIRIVTDERQNVRFYDVNTGREIEKVTAFRISQTAPDRVFTVELELNGGELDLTGNCNFVNGEVVGEVYP